eukprot:g8043.t1
MSSAAGQLSSSSSLSLNLSLNPNVLDEQQSQNHDEDADAGNKNWDTESRIGPHTPRRNNVNEHAGEEAVGVSSGTGFSFDEEGSLGVEMGRPESMSGDDDFLLQDDDDHRDNYLLSCRGVKVPLFASQLQTPGSRSMWSLKSEVEEELDDELQQIKDEVKQLERERDSVDASTAKGLKRWREYGEKIKKVKAKRNKIYVARHRHKNQGEQSEAAASSCSKDLFLGSASTPR